MWIDRHDVAEGARPEEPLPCDWLECTIVPKAIGLFVLRYPLHAYRDLVLVGPNGERTTHTTGDSSGYVAEITYASSLGM